jgi:hypothetical protein
VSYLGAARAVTRGARKLCVIQVDISDEEPMTTAEQQFFFSIKPLLLTDLKRRRNQTDIQIKPAQPELHANQLQNMCEALRLSPFIRRKLQLMCEPTMREPTTIVASINQFSSVKAEHWQVNLTRVKLTCCE